jgi:hypothetical protein
MLNRRAQVETQFNWIFILVAGAIILIFFTAIVIKQKSSSDIRISESVMTDLESIFTGGSLSAGTSQLIETPNIEINFDCTGYDIKGVKKQTGGLILFAPSTVKGRNILTWNLDFNMPYKVTGFLYITSPEMRYIFVKYDGLKAARMNSTLPKNMNLEFVDSTDTIKDKNNYKVRLIAESDIFNGEACPPSIADMGDDLTALAITGNTLKFYNCGNDGSFKLTGTGTTALADVVGAELKPSLYGAIFTDDIDIYNCMTGKAFERAYFVSKVYEKRFIELDDYYKNKNSQCVSSIFTSGDLGNYVNIIKPIYTKFDAGQMREEEAKNLASAISDLGSEAEDMAYQNKILLQNSCALIY